MARDTSRETLNVAPSDSQNLPLPKPPSLLLATTIVLPVAINKGVSLHTLNNSRIQGLAPSLASAHCPRHDRMGEHAHARSIMLCNLPRPTCRLHLRGLAIITTQAMEAAQHVVGVDLDVGLPV